jgi:RND family efflux transporter MFP subunit
MPHDDLPKLNRTDISNDPRDGTTRRRWAAPTLGAIAVAALGFGIFWGLHTRAEAESELARDTDAAAVPVVDVVHPANNEAGESLVLPGNTQAFSDTAIFARTNGYLTHWYFDIGAHVKKGQLLAEIDTPEVDDQLRQALADLATAEANLKLAAITAERNENLLKTHSVATQDRDNAVGTLNTDKAIVQSRQATVAQLQQLQGFEKVYAPFDGIVTARNVDVGALVNAGSNGTARELFHMVAIDTLRIFVAVPEPYAPAMQPGAVAAVTVDEFPGQTFKGTLARTSNSIDPMSRTLLVEVDVENGDGKLLPGAYATVHFTLPGPVQSVTVPANTLLFRKEGLQVGIVRDGKVDLTPVKIGRDYGDHVEVIAGLAPTDDVVINPADSLTSGTKVRVNNPQTVGSAK